MYSQLVFNINNQKVTFEFHEIVQIALSLVDSQEWQLIDQSAVNQTSLRDNTVILNNQHAAIHQAGDDLTDDAPHDYPFKIDDELIAARMCASNEAQLAQANADIIQDVLEHSSLDAVPNIMSPETHHLFLSLVKEPEFIFAEDLTYLKAPLLIPPMASQINSLAKWRYLAQYYRNNYLKKPNESLIGWWVEIAGRLLLIKNTQEHGYYISDHGLLREIVHGVQDIVFNTPWTNPEFVMHLMKAQQKIADISQNEDDLIKKQQELAQSFVDEPSAVIQQFNPTLTDDDIQEEQQQLAQRLQAEPLLAATYWNHSLETMSYIVQTLARRFMAIKLTPNHPDSPFTSLNDKADVYSEATDFQYQLFDMFKDEPARVDEMIRIIVLASLAKDINRGKHKSLFRPIFSYGDKDKGAPYHQLASSAVAYMTDRQSSNQHLAQAMRQILTGQFVDTTHLGFLVNLVGAWFISETARNPLSLLTGMMVIDMIENQIELIIDGVNIYTLQYALIHPDNDEPKKKIKDICGQPTTPWKVGGAHPMAHEGSESQAALDNNGRLTRLSMVRQKEGRLLLQWLFIHLTNILVSNAPQEFSVTLVDSTASSIKNNNLNYAEIAFNKKTASKLNKKSKIDKTLLLKQQIQWYLLEPLLELRLNVTDNLYTQAPQFFAEMFNNFMSAIQSTNKRFISNQRYRFHTPLAEAKPQRGHLSQDTASNTNPHPV